MNPIDPDTGGKPVVFAKDQPEYKALPIAVHRVPDNARARYLLSRWQPTPEEREAIARGDDIFIAQLNFLTPMTPMIVQVGPGWFATEDARE